MSKFTPYQEELKIKERVDQILASNTPEELQKVLKPYTLEERRDLLNRSAKQCIRIIEYYDTHRNEEKTYHYLSLESVLEDLETEYLDFLITS